MSRTGLYWTDDRDRLNCAHGVILHGTKCINCERGDIPDTLTAHERAAGSRRFMFDTASGPDRTATGTYQRVGDEMRFTVDDIKVDYDWREKVERRTREAINGNHARMCEMADRMEEALRRTMWPPEHFNCRSTVTDPPWDWGGPPRSRAIEVITDPLDQRGVNARRVGPGR